MIDVSWFISKLVSVEPEEELPKSTEVIDDGITAPVSVEPEEKLQLCITKGTGWGANSTEGGASVRSNR